MRYREYDPDPALERLVQCYWTLEQGAEESEPQKVVPDGCMEVILHFGAHMPSMESDGSIHEQPASFVVGQIRSHVMLVPTGLIETLGIRLRPGGAHLFLGMPVHELVDGAVTLDALDDPLLCDIDRRIRGHGEWAQRIRLLDRLLRESLAPRLEGPDLSEAAAERIVARHGRVSIDGLASELGASTRTLERRLGREVGLSPKRLARIARFQRAFELIGSSTRLVWTDVALGCGYADQSHLVREFRELAGEPPAAFLRADHELSDHLTGLAHVG